MKTHTAALVVTAGKRLLEGKGPHSKLKIITTGGRDTNRSKVALYKVIFSLVQCMACIVSN